MVDGAIWRSRVIFRLGIHLMVLGDSCSRMSGRLSPSAVEKTRVEKERLPRPQRNLGLHPGAACLPKEPMGLQRRILFNCLWYRQLGLVPW
jgi:hypothetical protein